MEFIKTALDKFIESNAWDTRHNIPNSPTNNNPAFYTALATVLISKWDYKDVLSYPPYRNAVEDFIVNAETDIGLFNRWPDGHGGPTSQDELIGIAYLDSKAAFRIMTYLFTHDGIYINPACFDDKYKQFPYEILEERQDMNRFYWLMPYLRTCAGMKVSLLSQFLYCLYLIPDSIFAKPDDASGRLLRFVMNERMKKHWMCAIFIDIWRWAMKKKGITPKSVLVLEPAENPVFAEHAPMEF